MSRLIREDDDYLYIQAYLHQDSDSYPEWLCSPDGRYCPDPTWPDFIVEAEHYATYEIQLHYRINKHTGEVSNYEVIQ